MRQTRKTTPSRTNKRYQTAVLMFTGHCQEKGGSPSILLSSYIYIAFLFGMMCLFPNAIASDYPGNSASNAHSQNIAKLKAAYVNLQTQLNNHKDQFHLVSNLTQQLGNGDVYAVINYPLEKIRDMLMYSKEWCNSAILHINVKSCVTDNLTAGDASIKLFIGDEDYLEPEDANLIQYRYTINDVNDNYIRATLSADSGPLDTKQQQVIIEMMRLNNDSSFIHYAYSAKFGFITRTLLNTYSSTLGRGKVGFSNLGVDEEGNPQYVTGILGIMERNTMRYFFAFASYLHGLNFPEDQRLQARMNQWFNYTEKYKRQLYEIKRGEYLSRKSQEYRNQVNLQIASRTPLTLK